MNQIKIAIVVGHTPKGDQGAYSPHLQKSEQPFNLGVAANALKELAPNTYDVYTHTIQGYYERQKALATLLNGKAYDLVIELHFNAASPLANGTECLYWFASKKGKEYAQAISAGIAKEYGTTIRGDKGARALVNKEDRGYWFTYLPKAPAVIVEPFFGSNEEALKFKDEKRYACVLHNILMGLNYE